VIIEISLIVLLTAGALFAYRLIRGPTLADRVNSLNGLLVVGSNAIAAHAMQTGQGAFLPVLVVVALVGFVGTAMVARFVEGGGR
jgi:multisubunit Na+/H+ antiporter MnhF subunit